MIKIVTSWNTLIKLAHELGQAKKSGDPERLANAQAEHDAYAEICLKADTMLLHERSVDLK